MDGLLDQFIVRIRREFRANEKKNVVMVIIICEENNILISIFFLINV